MAATSASKTKRKPSVKGQVKVAPAKLPDGHGAESPYTDEQFRTPMNDINQPDLQELDKWAEDMKAKRADPFGKSPKRLSAFWSVAFIVLIAALLYLFDRYVPTQHYPVYPPYIFGLALSLGFYWVNNLRFGSVKPFTCVKCMTGWFALIIAVPHYGWDAILFAPVGLFIGAMYEAVRMRWL